MKKILMWLKGHLRLLVSLTGVALIPLIYAGVLIAANSDPTGRLHEVPALVVNLDTAATTSTGESIDLGPDIVKELEDSTEASNLQWREASEADANAALADGSALAVLTVPKGFSAAVASAGDDDPQAATPTQLQVRTNDASNFLMGTIAKAVGNEVTDSVRTQVSEEYLKNVYVGFTDLHGSLVDAADGATQLKDGSVSAEDGAGQLVVGLKKLADGTVTLDAGAVKLASGASTLSTGASTLSTGTSTLSDGLAQLKAKTSSLPEQASALNDGAQQIADGTDAVNTAAKQLKQGAASASSGATKLSDGAASVDEAAGQLAKGSAAVAQGTQQLSDTATEMAKHVKAVSAGTQETLGALGTLLEDTTGLSSSTKVDVAGTAAQAQAGLTAILKNPTVQAAIAADPALAAKFEALKKDLPAVAEGAATTQKAIDAAEKAAGVVKDQQGTSIDDLIASAKKVDAAADALSTKVGQLNDGAQQVADGNAKLAESTPALAQGAKDLADGNQRLADGTAKLAQSTPTLKDGAAQLAEGTQSLSAAVPNLTTAISDAATGASKLATGASQLSTGASQLSTGAHTLADGTGSLVSGADQASTGSQDLEEGLGKLKDGSATLSDGLASGVDEVPNYSASDREHLSSVTSDPVRLDKTSSNSMANYGTGLSPYFLSLALWIGGIAFFMLMAPLPAKLLARRLPAPLTAARALLPSGIMALVQASIAVAVLLFGLRIDVAHPWQLYGLALFASLAFVWLNQGLVALLGAPGRFLSLIMVVLQVGTSGGTYPWQTLPEPLQGVHPLLPMSYTVRSFRSLVAGGESIGLGSAYGILALYLVIGVLFLLAAAFLAPRRSRIYDTATLAPGLPGGGRSQGEYSFEDARFVGAQEALPDADSSPREERVLVGAGVGSGASSVGSPAPAGAAAPGASARSARLAPEPRGSEPTWSESESESDDTVLTAPAAPTDLASELLETASAPTATDVTEALPQEGAASPASAPEAEDAPAPAGEVEPAHADGASPLPGGDRPVPAAADGAEAAPASDAPAQAAPADPAPEDSEAPEAPADVAREAGPKHLG
ncbi:MAG: YhgE/Pip domain-containing protein [Arthrobacter sp.]|nr:YhgE/Pip domain-containing protein [Arthrobacter sp.]